MTLVFPDPDQVPPRWGTLANRLTLAGLGLPVFGVTTGVPRADSGDQELAALLLAWTAVHAQRHGRHAPLAGPESDSRG